MKYTLMASLAVATVSLVGSLVGDANPAAAYTLTTGLYNSLARIDDLTIGTKQYNVFFVGNSFNQNYLDPNGKGYSLSFTNQTNAKIAATTIRDILRLNNFSNIEYTYYNTDDNTTVSLYNVHYRVPYTYNATTVYNALGTKPYNSSWNISSPSTENINFDKIYAVFEPVTSALRVASFQATAVSEPVSFQVQTVSKSGSVPAQAVPEPSTILGLGTTIGFMALLKKRNNHSNC